MESVLLILEFVLAAFITIAVMLQKSSSIGLGAYSGSNESVFGAKGPAAFLAKITMFLSIAFVVNTVSLSYLYSSKRLKVLLITQKLCQLFQKNQVKIKFRVLHQHHLHCQVNNAKSHCRHFYYCPDFLGRC